MKLAFRNVILTVLAVAAGLVAGSPRRIDGQGIPTNTNLVVHDLVATAVSSNQINLTWQTDSLDGNPPLGWQIWQNGVLIAIVTNRFEAPKGLTITP